MNDISAALREPSEQLRARLDPAAAAAEALSRYELIVESMTEGVSVSSEEGIIVYTNPAEDRMFGYAPGELAGQHVSVQNAYPPEENKRRVGEVIAALKSEGRWDGEWLNRRKDGSEFVTASRITAVELGGATHWLCVQRDVTAVREAENRFRRLANHVPSFVWFAYPDGALRYLNERWYEYTGQSEMGALPDGWAEAIHPDDLVRVGAAWDAARARGLPYQDECRIRSRNGRYRWFLARSEPERDSSGAIVEWFGTSTDIHDWKLTETELRESARRLDLAVTAHGIGIFDWHIPSGHLLWTRQEEQLFGLPEGSFGGSIEDWAACLLPEDLSEMQARMGEAMARREEALDFAFRIRRRDGAIRWIEGSSRFLYAPDGSPERMVGTNVDVTERRRAEEHQRLLVNELNHRVKNTLAIVQGLARQTFRDTAGGAEACLAFERRLAALSNAHDILTGGHWEGASIGSIVDGAIAPYRTASGDFALDGPDVPVTPKMAVSLALALHELATNAAKYGALSVRGGRIEIGWEVQAGRLRLMWRERGGPPVQRPARRGFGTRMIERALAAELDGEVRLEFDPAGVICTVEAPLPTR